MKNLLSTEFDTDFDVLINDGILCWKPWVGCEYTNGKRVIAALESHYTDNKELADCIANRDFTRCIFEDPQHRANRNLLEVLCDSGYVDNDDCLKRIAMYNIIQRPMIEEDDGSRERPNEKDYQKGWEAFKSLLKLLKPDYCLIGFVGGDNAFQRFFNYEVSLQTNSARIATLTIDNHKTEIIMIPHPSGPHFNKNGGCQGWHDYLKKHYYEMLQKINQF